MAASDYGHFEVVQLLSACGANLNHLEPLGGESAADLAARSGHPDIAEFLLHVIAHALAPLQIAAALRMDRCIRWLLRRGIADPADYAPAGALMAAAIEIAPWPGALPPSMTTTSLVRQSLLPWSAERHWLFHSGGRLTVHTLQLVERRLEQQAVASAMHLQLPLLPTELWHVICTFVQRGDFHSTA